MGWGHIASCPDCHHEWDWISTSAYLGPWPLVPDAPDEPPIRGWCCRCCHRQLWLPRAIARSAWQKWHERFLAGEGMRLPTAYLKGVVAMVDECLGDANPQIPVSLDLDPGNCPGCQQPFEPIPEEGGRVICPRCHREAAMREGSGSHYSMSCDEFGFS